MHDEQNRPEPAVAVEVAPRQARRRRLLLLTALALLVPASLVGGYVVLRALPGDCSGQQQTEIDPPPVRPIPWYARADKPDLVLVISGQLHGYMKPCGCSEPQYGGLARRLAFIDQLKAKGWDVAGVDLGELAATEGIPRQRELKFLYSMKALDVMGYRAIGMGKNEMLMPLTDALVLYSAQQKVAQPRPLASTLDKLDKPNDVYHGLGARRFETFGADGPDAPRVGVLSLTGPDLSDSFRHDKSMKFLNNSVAVLPKVHQAFAKDKVDLAILMHHEYPNDPVLGGLAAPLKMEELRRGMAERCAVSWEQTRKGNPAIPPLYLLLVLSALDEPASMLRRVPNTPTYLLEIGHKGKYVGVLGVFRKGAGADPKYELKYDLALMEPKLDPAPGQKNAIVNLLEEYAKQVKTENLLEKYIRSPHPIQVDPYVVKKYGGSRYIGSDACANCHAQEGIIHAKTKHANAFKDLVKAKQPTLREFDPECVICHTVGFKHPEGYDDLPRAFKQRLQGNPVAIKQRLAKHNAELTHVGCENCHGPGSAHANNPNDPKVRELMNPYRPSEKEKQLVQQMRTNPNALVRQQAAANAKRLFDRRMQRLDDFCQKCHDAENDVNWAKVPFLQKWAGGAAPIIHNRHDNVGNVWLPPRNPAAQAGVPRKAE